MERQPLTHEAFMETSSCSYLFASERALFVHGSVEAHLISEVNHARHKSTLVDTHNPFTECSNLCLIHNKLHYFDWVQSALRVPYFHNSDP